MNTVKIDLCGLPDELRSGLENCVCTRDFVPARTEYGFLPAGAEPFPPSSTDRLRVEYCEPVQFFRALSYLKRADHRRFALHRQPVFEHTG